MMKRQYIKPTMREVRIRQAHIICASTNGYVNSMKSNSEGITWKNGGFVDEEADY